MQPSIVRYLPYIIAGLAITVIMVGAYVSVGPIQSAAPKAGWGTDPVTITFASAAGQASKPGQFGDTRTAVLTCASTHARTHSVVRARLAGILLAQKC